MFNFSAIYRTLSRASPRPNAMNVRLWRHHLALHLIGPPMMGAFAAGLLGALKGIAARRVRQGFGRRGLKVVSGLRRYDRLPLPRHRAGPRLTANAFRPPCAALGGRLSEAFKPDAHLNRSAAQQSAGPDQFKRRELSPDVVAMHHGAGDQIAGERSGVEPVTAKTAGEPHPGSKLADLRHAVHGVAERPRPGEFRRDRTELRVSLFDIGGERTNIMLRIARPRSGAPRPHQPIAADNAVVIVGAIGVAHRTAVSDRLAKPRSDGLCGDDIGRDRNEIGRAHV